MKEWFIKHYKRLTPIDVLVSVHCVVLIILISIGSQNLGSLAFPFIGRYLVILIIVNTAIPVMDSIKHPLVQNPFVQFIRYFYPMMLLGSFYRWSQPVSHMFFEVPFDQWLLAADIKLFGFNIAQDLVYMWGNKYWLTEWLNFSYLSYYWVTLYLPFYLYFSGRMKEFFYVVFIGGLVVYFCFFFQSFFPAEGPIYNDPSLGEHLKAGYISYAAHQFLIRADVPGSAMPSAHIAGTVGIWFLAWRYGRKAFWLTSPVVIGLCIATVYCRFHYAVDGIAGILVALLFVYIIGPRLYVRLFPNYIPESETGSEEKAVPAVLDTGGSI